MAWDGGRLGLINQFEMGEGVSNPFRGVFEEGVRQTAVDYERSQMENDPRFNKETGKIEQDWNRPVLNAQGAISSQFGDYRMTPQSPSVREGHQTFDFYQLPEEMMRDEPPVVDPQQDPAGALAGATLKASYAGGGYTPMKVEPAPPMKMQADKAMDQEGKQVMFDMNKIPAWHESNAFSTGLLSFGLNLLSGNDLATSFNQAAGAFDKSFGKEKRQAWAQDLVEQGYDAHEIQSWIETGDHKALSDPMQKKMQQQQYKLGQMQLQRAMYENSPEYLEWQSRRQAQKDQLELTKFEADQQYRAASLNLQAMGNKIREQAALAKQAGANDLTSRDYSQLASTVMPTIKVANQRINYSDAAMRDLADIEKYKKEGNDAGVQGSYKSFQYNMARAVKGGGATLTEKDVAGASALTNAWDDTANILSLKTTGAPTQMWLDTMRKSVTNDMTNQTNGVRMIAEQVYNTYAPVFGHEKAQNVVRRIVAGGAVGNLVFDPRTGSLVSDDRVDRVGPGTVKIQR